MIELLIWTKAKKKKILKRKIWLLFESTLLFQCQTACELLRSIWNIFRRSRPTTASGPRKTLSRTVCHWFRSLTGRMWKRCWSTTTKFCTTAPGWWGCSNTLLMPSCTAVLQGSGNWLLFCCCLSPRIPRILWTGTASSRSSTTWPMTP